MSSETTRQHEKEPKGPTPIRPMAANAREAGRGSPWHPSLGGSPPAADGFIVEWQFTPAVAGPDAEQPSSLPSPRLSEDKPEIEEAEATTFRSRLLRLYSVHDNAGWS
jgi:hypothetical protein